MSLKTFFTAVAAVATLSSFGGSAQAAVFTEEFEAPFEWDIGWFGLNSDARNYNGTPRERGNNPDGLWLDGAPFILVTFSNPFADELMSFHMDVAVHADGLLSFFDKDGVLIQDFMLTRNDGGFTDPGTYVRYGVTSNNGIGSFRFDGSADGQTSIDNLRAVTGAVIPEPATWALMIGGFGLTGAALRRHRALAA